MGKKDIKNNIKNIAENLSKLNIERINEIQSIYNFEASTPFIEKYRLFPLFESYLKQLTFAKATKPTNIHDVCTIENINSQKIFVVNGYLFCNNEISGVSITSINEKSSQNNTSKDFCELVNDALYEDGFVIEVEDNKTIEKLIQITRLASSNSENIVTASKNEINIGKNSELNIVICNHTENNKHYFNTHQTLIKIGCESKLNILEIQSEEMNSSLTNNISFELDKDTVVSHKIITLHGGLIRNNITANLNGENADYQVYGIYLTDNSQQIDNYIEVKHKASLCRSNQIFKGILDDYSKVTFAGKIIVNKNAQQTDAYQLNRNILLKDTATIDSKPQLEIYANDVKCSHGSSVGQINRDELYYLRSRGINEDEAFKMLKFAFLNEIVQKIKIESIRNSVKTLIEKRLSGDCLACFNKKEGCGC